MLGHSLLASPRGAGVRQLSAILLRKKIGSHYAGLWRTLSIPKLFHGQCLNAYPTPFHVFFVVSLFFSTLADYPHVTGGHGAALLVSPHALHAPHAPREVVSYSEFDIFLAFIYIFENIFLKTNFFLLSSAFQRFLYMLPNSHVPPRLPAAPAGPGGAAGAAGGAAEAPAGGGGEAGAHGQGQFGWAVNSAR